MKKQKHFLTLLLILGAWPGVRSAQAATADAVGAWGNNDHGQTTVPVAAQSDVTAIAAGGSHTVSLKTDGSVVAWGDNEYGQTTVPLEAQSGVRAISAGLSHTVVLKNDGSVVAWGRNVEGQTTVPAGLSGVTAIAAGWYHTVALKTDGSVAAWGYNGNGETTVPVEAQSGVTAIAAGHYYTVALKTDGSVVAWGDNEYGQTTVPVAARSGVTAIAAGVAHTVALKNDGSVVAWGRNLEGQTTVPGGLSGVTAIAASWYHTVALKNDGSVVVWGRNLEGQTTVPAGLSGATAIAAGGLHTVALVIPTVPAITRQPASQTVKQWQSASFTVTATGYPLNYQWRRDGVNLAEPRSATYNLGPVQTNRAGCYTVVGSNSAGSVTSAPPAVLTVNPVSPDSVAVGAWGLNDFGQTTVPVAAQSGVTAIAAGLSHTVALKIDGSVVAWGANNAGQTTVPAGLSGVTAIAAGRSHTVALKNDGTVVAWGSIYDGANYITATVPSGLSGVTAIAAGGRHNVALKNDGTVVAWEANGQTTVPAGLSGVTAIAAGGGHTVVLVVPTAPAITTQPVSQTVNEWRSASFSVAVMGYPLYYQWRKDGVDLAEATSASYSLDLTQTNQAGSYTVVVSNPAGSVTSAPPAVLTVNVAPGSVLAWGDDPYGQTDVPVAAQSGVTAIAAGGFHTVALKNDGSVVAWGYNSYGQTDVPVAAQSGVTAIAAGWLHTVALKNDGSVVAWGWNSSGEVTGTPTSDQPTASPVTLGGQVLSGVTAIAAGSGLTVALKNDGTVVAWGYNGSGQVTGTPTMDDPNSATASPVTLGSQVLSGVTAIAAGSLHTVALKNDGTVVAWGYNGSGQVTGTPTLDDPNSATASPVTLGGQVLSGVTAIAAGSLHTVALKNDGSVVAWGNDGSGQTDVPVAAQSGVTAIAAGDFCSDFGGCRGHTLALKNDGSVVAWGYDAQGKVTLGGQVLTGVTAIAAGSLHTVALLGTGLVTPISLNARPSGNELILSWSTNVVGFTLQSTLSLTAPLTWIDSTSAPAVIGAQFTVTKTITGGAQFYRLRKR